MCATLRVFVLLRVPFSVTLLLIAQPAVGEELLDFVREAHRASRQLIQTCSCRVEFNGTVTSPNGPPKIESCSGRFWYSRDAVRGRVTEFGKLTDYVWQDSVRKGVVRWSADGKPVSSGLRDSQPNRYIGRCDAWTRGLLVLNRPNGTECIPFEDLQSKATRVKNAKKRSINGKEMIVVNLFFEAMGNLQKAWDLEVHFDPSVNYLVRKTIYTTATKEGTYSREDEITKFKECGSGVFFPEEHVGRSGLDPNFDFTHTTVISEIQVNQTLPDDTFTLRYPDGVFIRDTIRGVRYQANSEGSPISPEINLDSNTRFAPPPLGQEAPSSHVMATQEEPRSSTRWILPISAAILVIGVVAVFVRRLRKMRTES